MTRQETPMMGQRSRVTRTMGQEEGIFLDLGLQGSVPTAVLNHQPTHTYANSKSYADGQRRGADYTISDGAKPMIQVYTDIFWAMPAASRRRHIPCFL
jgi:hypothetical protein